MRVSSSAYEAFRRDLYMQEPESVLENETHEILWDFMMLMDHLIRTKRIDQVFMRKYF